MLGISLTLDDKTLHGLLEDAWCQHMAWQTNHKTMEDLHGMDRYLTTYQVNKLLPLERSLLSALQSGAFVSSSEHSKYECRENSFFVRYVNVKMIERIGSFVPVFDTCVRTLRTGMLTTLNYQRVLCIICSFLVLQKMVDWRHTLHQLQDCSKVFHVYPPKVQTQHLFTDGNMYHAKNILACAWLLGVWSAPQLVMWWRSGICMDKRSPLIELNWFAVIAAVQWSQEADIYVWSDSLSTVTTAEYIQEHRHVPISVENHDLWLELWDGLDAA